MEAPAHVYVASNELCSPGECLEFRFPNGLYWNLPTKLVFRLIWGQTSIANVTKTSFVHICTLWHVRDLLPYNVAETVACSIISLRLDYCFSLFADLLRLLQHVQNTGMCRSSSGQIRANQASTHSCSLATCELWSSGFCTGHTYLSYQTVCPVNQHISTNCLKTINPKSQ